jgi:hypothetical protein
MSAGDGRKKKQTAAEPAICKTGPETICSKSGTCQIGAATIHGPQRT